MTSRSIPVYWRACLDCTRRIQADSPALRCSSCAAEHELRQEGARLAHYRANFGAQQAMWSSAWRASLRAGRTREEASWAADRIVAIMRDRGHRGPLRVLPLPGAA